MNDRVTTLELPDESPPAREGGLIGSLQNGLDVFEMFDRTRTIVTVGEIAKHLGVHKSSASRIAATLVASGYLRPARGAPGFQLGGKLVRLGSLATVDTTLVNVSEPVMRDLVESHGETCHVGVLEGSEVVTVALMDGSHALRLHSWVGKRSPAHLSSMGKVLLAGLDEVALERLYPENQLEVRTPFSIGSVEALKVHLEKVRKQGYALDNEELEIGLRCVAMPIRDYTNRIVASIAITGTASRIQVATIDSYIEAGKAAAAQMSMELGAPQAGNSSAHVSS